MSPEENLKLESILLYKKKIFEDSLKEMVEKGEKLADTKARRAELAQVKRDLAKVRKELKGVAKALKGGALKASLIRDFFQASHESELRDVPPYKIDKEISTKLVRVYFNNKDNWVVVVHRGSGDLKDVFYDSQLLFDYKDNKRFKESKKVQAKAEKKYDPTRMTVLGSSLGGKLAEDSASDKVHEVITSGKPTTVGDVLSGKKVPDNQFDVRTHTDPISILKPLQPGKGDITLKSKNPLNPVKSHVGDEVFSEKYFDKDQLIGHGTSSVGTHESKSRELTQADLKGVQVRQLKEYIKQQRKKKKLPVKEYPISKVNKSQLKELAIKISKV